LSIDMGLRGVQTMDGNRIKMSNGQPTSGEDGRSSSTATSRSLLARAREHDPGAWERMVALYAPLVLHWCRRWGLPPTDAADVFQAVSQPVATPLDGSRRARAGDTFRGWLRAITRNKVNDYFRRREREPGAVGGSEARVLLAQLPEPIAADEDA